MEKVTHPLETHVYQGQVYSVQVLENPRRYQVIVNKKYIETEQLPEFDKWDVKDIYRLAHDKARKILDARA